MLLKFTPKWIFVEENIPMKTVQQASLSGIAVLSFCAMGMAQAPAGGPAGGPPPPRPNCANLRRDFSRRRKFYKQDHRRHASLDASAKGLPEGLGTGDLPDGTRNGPGIAARRGTPAYFGPGAGPGPIHHYVFEFYALDTKLDLPASTTREDLLKAMDGHVVGKAAWFGRFHAPPQ
jgi:hypothetical protein